MDHEFWKEFKAFCIASEVHESKTKKNFHSFMNKGAFAVLTVLSVEHINQKHSRKPSGNLRYFSTDLK